MKTHKLERRTCLNPYYIGGMQIEKMHFFNNGEIIASANRGWLPAYGSNSSGNSALEAIEYRRKRKPDLNAKYSFFISDELYINTDALPEFLYAPDVLELETKEARHYGNRVYFECGSTDGRHEHLERVELRSFMVGCYSKIVPTPFGEKVKAIVSVFKDNNIRLSSYDAAKLMENSADIISAIKR